MSNTDAELNSHIPRDPLPSGVSSDFTLWPDASDPSPQATPAEVQPRAWWRRAAVPIALVFGLVAVLAAVVPSHTQ